MGICKKTALGVQRGMQIPPCGVKGQRPCKRAIRRLPVPRRRLALGKSLRHCNLASLYFVSLRRLPECRETGREIKLFSLAICGSCAVGVLLFFALAVPKQCHPFFFPEIIPASWTHRAGERKKGGCGLIIAQILCGGHSLSRL